MYSSWAAGGVKVFFLFLPCYSFFLLYPYLDKWKVTRVVTGRIMPWNDLPWVNSRCIKGCHDISIPCWCAVVPIKDNYVFCEIKITTDKTSWYRAFVLYGDTCILRKVVGKKHMRQSRMVFSISGKSEQNDQGCMLVRAKSKQQKYI